MPAASDRLEFLPPRPPALLRSFILALLAHLILLAVLTIGLQWRRDSHDMAAEAELWSSMPQQAAPKEVPAPPPPPQPEVKQEVKPQPPLPKESDITLEEEKKKKAAEREEQIERERLERERKLAEKRKHEEELKKQLAEKKKKEEQEAKRVAQQREENLRRSLAQANATGSPNATGNALQSSGPSASWAGRIRARVKPNIVFSDEVAGNPSADVEVRLAPDGTITSRRLVKSSGTKSWDDAVLRALDKTEVLPRDTDGRVHSPVVIEFKPKG